MADGHCVHTLVAVIVLFGIPAAMTVAILKHRL
jgi:hypothetical protein